MNVTGDVVHVTLDESRLDYVIDALPEAATFEPRRRDRPHNVTRQESPHGRERLLDAMTQVAPRLSVEVYNLHRRLARNIRRGRRPLSDAGPLEPWKVRVRC